MTHPFVRPASFLRLIAFVLPVTLLGCAGGGGGGSSSTTTPPTTTTPTPTSTTLSVAAVSPTNIPVGANDTTVVVTGTGFTTTSVVSLNTTAEATTYVSSTEVHATVPAAQLKTGVVLNVSVANGTTVAKLDPAVAALSVDNPVPSLTLVAPTAVLVGSAAASVTVTGTNFVPGVALSVNGSLRTTTFVSDTQLTAALTADDFAVSKSLPLNVINPKPGGGTSGTNSLSVSNPVPALTSISPTSIVQGSTPPTVTLTGGNFNASSAVLVNGGAHASTFVSANSLKVVLTAADIVNATTLPITVVNAQPGGGTSAAASFVVTARATSPSISYVSPTSFYTGAGDTNIFVIGGGTSSTATVQWKGTTLTSTYGVGSVSLSYYSTYNGPYMYARVPASLLSAAGTAAITLTNSTYPNPTSLPVTVTIVDPPAPTISSLATTAAPVGAALDLTVYGTGFSSGSYASFNGTQVSTTVVNSGQLTARLTTSMLSQLGAGVIRVFTPAPGGGTSNAVTLPIYAPLKNNSMVYSPSTGLLWLSVPSSAGAPYGNSVVSMDPATGALGRPIPVGSEPNKLAITSDGKYLWVGLDGANGVRKVDLTTNTAGLQFALNAGSGSSPIALALQALPGVTDSVVVLQSTSSYSYYATPALYDSGVLRGTMPTGNYYSYYALQVDGSRNEIYVGGGALQTFTYSSSGLTAKTTSTNSSISLASSSLDDMQLASGTLIGSQGKIYDAEAGTLLGTLYQTGTVAAVGPTTYDSALGKIFVLDSSSAYCCNNYTQIQVFKGSDYTATGDLIPFTIPYNLYDSTGLNTYLNPSRLTRWGSNGLAVRTAIGVFSLRSNLVKDLSATLADLGVTATATGGTSTGTSTTYTFQVKNAGPSTAKDVALAIQTPSTGVFTGATTTVGICSTQTAGCNLGDIANGATVTINVTVLETSAGTATATATAIASSTDNNAADNSASAAVVVAGSNYNLQPTLSSISPNAVKAGSADTTITVLGTNFASGSTVMVGSTAASTTFVNAGKLTAVVPSANLANMGWSSIGVSTPAPGGGNSNTLPLSVYSVLSLGVNRMVYDPYSRKLVAAVSTGSSSVAGSSLVAITPETATIGSPVALTNVPTRVALSASGQTLWLANATNATLARYNMLTGAVATSTPSVTSIFGSYYTPIVADLAVQPGTEDSLALGFGNYVYNFGMFDYSSASNSFTERSSYSTNYYYSSCMRFLDSSSLFLNNDSTGMYYFGVGSNGLSPLNPTSTTLNRFNCFKIANGRAYAGLGGVATLATSGAISQTGGFTLPSNYNNTGTSGSLPVEPDASVGAAFFAASTSSTNSYSNADGVLSFDIANYLRTGAMSLNMTAIEGTSNFSVNDIFRWGQDGLALSTSTGHIYLLRGPFVVPQLLNTNTAAVLTSASASTITHGAGNTLLTLTGSNFVPGVAVTWNGSYRTTTIVDATHVTVAIPAADLAAAGSGSLVATNPGASASGAVTVTIQ
ncbi:hypothetical protein Terro_0069 [Terriglobus roseus DSM 18391]|uniref:DUF11 domain-containing protein n=1 Tax=Terriglobus roseus (strain DSM 18391 / NRRL B-41598 / KBS 63) TaxID=926566 RepID=I3ZB02_TERRK|nr:DUF11 domain-containing protein [Terriglobus roseus]AFL86420.1 hypothetical protein Terro_0069 [Terriglobus roseus DSM 18391]